MPRMKILSTTEMDNFDKPPIFNSGERKRFFDVTADLLNTAHNLRKPAHKIGFIVACGYFRATRKFFNQEDYHPRDMECVAKKLGMRSDVFSSKEYLRSRIHYHRQLILKAYGYRHFDKDSEGYIKQEISDMVRAQLKPRLIFWRCVDLLNKNRIQVPNYDQLSKIILAALNQRKQDLVQLIDRELSDETRALLDSLFAQDLSSPTKADTSQYSRYKLTLLKKPSQSTKPDLPPENRTRGGI